MYPRLVIDLNKLRHNTKEVVGRCSRCGIDVCGVVKCYWADPVIARTYLECGAKQLGTSRLSQIRRMKEAGIETDFFLLRVPQMCELADVAELADYSLQSDLEVMKALNRECEKLDKVHKVVVMADLGDLREGFWDKDEMVDACVFVDRSLHNLELAGIGVNLGCYGAIQPTPEKMTDLIAIARRIEARIGRPLEIISGGATSTFSLVHWDTIPAGINHVRIGEGVALAYDLPYIWGIKDMDYLYADAFTLQAQVLEVRTKASYPQGKFCINAFGDVPVFEDHGDRKRALLAVGRADAGEVEKLRPRLAGAKVLGGSSDHLILDIEDCTQPVKPGDVLEFDICYANIVGLTISPDVEKEYIE